MKRWIGLLAFCLTGCMQAAGDGASIVVAPAGDTITPDGTLAASIGIETVGGVFTPLLARGCAVPCVSAQQFSTAEDGQREIDLHVFSGDAALTAATQPLGTFRITGMAAMPSGTPRIRVTFEAAAQGVTLSAVDSDGNARSSIARVTH